MVKHVPMQQHTYLRLAGLKNPLAIGIVALLLVACGSKKAGGDAIDLQNQELAMVRDQVCACKDEACARGDGPARRNPEARGR